MPHCDPCPPATSTFSRKRRSSLSVVATYCVPTGPCHCALRAQCVHTEVGAVLEAPVSAEGAGRNGSALAGAEGTLKPRGTPAAEQERLESQAFGQRALPPPRTTACKPPGGGHSWLPWALPPTPPGVQGEWAGPDQDSEDGRMWVSKFILGQGSPCPSLWWEGG